MSDRQPPDDPVAEFIRESDGMPNRREALRPGTLPGTFPDPQGDENRDPPRLPTPPPVFPSRPQNSVTVRQSPKLAVPSPLQPTSVQPDKPPAGDRKEQLMGSATTTTDHDFIRKWIEQRGGRPSRVKGTESRDGEGILRVDFAEPDDKLEPISWEEFFQTFEDRELAFLHQDKQGDRTSRFFKFVRRDNERH